MSTYRATRFLTLILAAICLLAVSVAQAQKIKVDTVSPPEAEQKSPPFVVTIEGEGLGDVVKVTFLVAGTKDKLGGVHVDNTQTQANGPTQVTTVIDVDEFATLGLYDIQVTTSRGRRGKGNTLFRVLQLGGSGNDNLSDGEDVPLTCWLDANDANPNVFDDTRGDYVNGERKVQCRTGGIAQPNRSGIFLDPHTRGPLKRAERKLDLALGGCISGLNFECSAIPAKILAAGASFSDLENATVSVHPYFEQGDIQLLDAGFYKMAMGLGLPEGDDRFIFQMMGRALPDEFHQGIWCDLEQNPVFEPDDAISQDVSVYVWPDVNDDGVADAYTVTTGVFDNPSDPTSIQYGSVEASVCSDTGQFSCGGPAGGDLCNFLGTIEVQFTWHATVLAQ